jgi:pimeloyl-ACP methyl ester carboxylesterase
MRQIPNARKVVLPGVGHMCNLENPSRFNKVVLDFLADL